ncbi:MAG: flagellar basal-body MS-ring/collar protein FliF [Myxococcota bacterium]
MADPASEETPATEEEAPPPAEEEAPPSTPLGKVRARWEALSARNRLLLAFGVAAAIAISAVVYLSNAEGSFETLFAGLSPEDSAAVTDRLRTMDIPFELGEAGSTVLVPADKVHEARLTLASEGLPAGGALGFELFDEQRFGESEFSERVKYHRALEGELSRTISHLAGVDHARVHLVLPRRALFSNEDQTATASVALRLRPGWQMREDRVRGIVHLVASSVRGLSPENVTVVDGHGRSLSNGEREEGDLASDALDFRQRLESEKAKAIQNLLDASLGQGKAVVRVAADVSFRREEQTEERFDPEAVATRSFQIEEERDPNQTGGGAEGVPGAVSNLPGGPEATAGAGTPGLARRNETRNFEVSKVTRRRIEPVGRLERLNVAVVVDGRWTGEGADRTFETRPEEELEQLRSIIASAAGINTERGDQMTVECVPFFDGEDPNALPPPDLLAELERWLPVIGIGVLVLVALIVALIVWRRRRKRKKEHEERREKLVQLATGEGGGVLGTGEEGEEGVDGALPELTLEDIPNESEADIRLLAHELAEADPSLAARVMQMWLREAEEDNADEDGAQEAA